MQPNMTVPCMAYGADILTDSKDIMYYLSKKHPEAGLYPTERKDDIDSFINLFYSRFGMIARFTFGNWLRVSEPVRKFIARGKNETSIEKLKQLVRENPDLEELGRAKLMAKTRFNFVGAMMRTNLAAVDASMQEILDVVEASLGKGAFVCGDTYTLADITATAFLARIHIIKKEAMFGVKTKKYWDQVKSRPSFQKAYVCSNWEDTLMSKQIAAFAKGADPSTIKWTGPPTVAT